MHYYQFNIGDYRRDTAHLTMLEHGAYRQLLDQYYLKEKPIPKDIEMRTLCARNADEVSAIEYILKTYFTLNKDGSGYIHKSCDEVIEKYNNKSESAKKSANARWNKDLKTNANAMRTHTEGNANNKPITNNHKPKEKGVKRFTPPSLDDVKKYCIQRNNFVDPDNFINFYEAKGWMVGKNKMKSWQASVRTWEKKSEKESQKPKFGNKVNTNTISLGKQKNILPRPGESMDAYEQRVRQAR